MQPETVCRTRPAGCDTGPSYQGTTMPTLQHAPQLAVALDLPEKKRAVALAGQLRGTVPW